MDQQTTALQYLAKSERLLRWLEKSHAEMTDFGEKGEVDDCERALFAVLTLVSSLHEALRDCASALGLHEWKRNLSADRSSDPCLKYVWKARNADIHSTVLRWDFGGFAVDFRITDADKANFHAVGFRAHFTAMEQHQRLLLKAYEVRTMEELGQRLSRRELPSFEAQQRLGIEVFPIVQTTYCASFVHRDHRSGHLVNIDSPTTHLGRPITPLATSVCRAVIDYYLGKLHELRSACAAAAPPSIPAVQS